MNRNIAGSSLVLLAALAPAVTFADLESDLLAREKEMWIAWGRKDVTPYTKYLDADFRFIAENAAPITGKETNVKQLMNHTCELRSISFEDVTVRELGSNVGVLGYTAIADIQCSESRDSLRLAITAVWHQDDGRWTTSHYHQSLITD